MGKTLLDQIDAEAIDGDLSKALRLCLKLGGQTGSTDLRTWAAAELSGYEAHPELPAYRKLHAPLLIDGVSPVHQVSGQQTSKLQLPEGVRELIRDQVELRQGIPELMATIREEVPMLKFAPPLSSEILALLNDERRKRGDPTTVLAIYWQVHRAQIEGVIETVRTHLVELVAEMRAGLGPGEDVPSAEVAEQALNIVVHGKGNRVEVNQNVGPGEIAISGVEQSEERGWFLAVKILTGLATLAAAILGLIQLLR